MITKLNQLIDLAKAKGKKRLVAAYANDSHTIGAVSAAIDLGIVDGTLVGDIDTIKKVCAEEGIDVNKFKLIQEANEAKAGVVAVAEVTSGNADLLMKGLLSTDKYMHAILNKEKGLMPGTKKDMLTHVAVFEIPAYHKLLICSDVAIIPAPDFKQKQAMIGYLMSTAKSLEIAEPKIYVLTPTQQMLVNIPSCAEAGILPTLNERAQQTNPRNLEGPLSLDIPTNNEAAETKKLVSPVAGDADCLLFPNLESSNVFYKCATKFAGAELACMVVGAKVPCILTSRGDSMQTKLNSIALASLSCK